MIIFQNYILYMPSLPPFARREQIATYQRACGGIQWREERIRAADGVALGVGVGEVVVGVGGKGGEDEGLRVDERKRGETKKRRVVVVYFQGNGSSLPPRLPSLSSVLNHLHPNPFSSSTTTTTTITTTITTTYTLFALSYRGYWTSKGRPSQRGITLDAAAALAYARQQFPSSAEEDVRLVLWGQSLGAGVALVAAAADLNLNPHPDHDLKVKTVDRAEVVRKDDIRRAEEEGSGPGETGEEGEKSRLEISGIILETPFVSVAAMLPALYPEKWLPYRYLTPFLTNHWDGEEALRKIGAVASSTDCARSSDRAFEQDDLSSSSGTKERPKVLILQAGRDEIVPKEHAIKLETVGKEVGLQVRRVEVGGALHTEAIVKAGGKRAVVEFLKEMATT